MSISGKMYNWGDGAKNVPEGAGVFALYNETKRVIYIGESTNLRATFTQYVETNFSNDPCTRETRYYKREFTSTPKNRVKELLAEYLKKHSKLPMCNLTKTKLRKDVPNEWGFYFYEGVGKTLYEAAFSPQELRAKIKEIPLGSLEFHQKRGDFARWIRAVFNNVHLAEAIEQVDQRGDDLRTALLSALTSVANARCPRCGRESSPVKTWKMAGRPSKKGERLQLTIGHYRCPSCTKTYRRAIAKEKITA